MMLTGIDTYERPPFAKGFLICGEVGFGGAYQKKKLYPKSLFI